MEGKMKKFISVFVAVIMIASLIPATVNADYVQSGDNGIVIVPYTTGDGITIDGTLAQGEWSETNKLSLDGTTTMVTWGIGTFEGHIDFYYSWGDKGLYMAAIVADSEIETGAANEGSLSTRFQIALNPAGIICDDWPGLFFSLTPVQDSDKVALMKHNWESSADGGTWVEEEDGYMGRYTFIKDGETVTGWNLECVIPWALIATEDRYTDLDDTDTIELTNFNPKDENRKRAFCTATICYVQSTTPDGVGLISTARTCTDGDAGNFLVDSYDLTLLFALADEINNRTTETEYFKAAEETEPETDAKTEAQTDAKTEAETDAKTEAETDAKTEAQTDASTAGTTDKAPETTQGTSSSTGGANTGVIIGIVIAAVVAVAAIVAAIVLSKKKKK